MHVLVQHLVLGGHHPLVDAIEPPSSFRERLVGWTLRDGKDQLVALD
ncbi:hypothetical protein [Myxococcus llanfairpwllgwyngyllgogerychwyrndrobwllllantysiliogogogochensis]|nr:hypothetical protein [Myxococcus llanfairpwllgwyngyllgogerychwyrndrobwllllantysiliogogogochensis]